MRIKNWKSARAGTDGLKMGDSKRGFTLLFSVLIGSLLFTLGLAIGNIALKEIILSSAGKESERAFFSADAGTECALYWDRQKGTFSASVGTAPSFQCAGQEITADEPKEIPNGAKTTFMLPIQNEPWCALVEVSKFSSGALTTKIESRGRNDCNEGDNPARVERALRVTY